ncbi:uncharacterized protein [Musca autumnalis]|uniref:uncharacterized protein n=1 Tax=Musca autumnalis TaxID=221902 RepID=UPI003CEDE97F
MAFRFAQFLAVGCLFLVAANAAAIDNSIAEPRIASSEDLITNIVDNCFNENGMHCLKEKVLTYLDNVSGVEEEVSGRALSDDVMDKAITDRVARILNTNEIRVQLPQTLFDGSVITYRADRGFDLEVTETDARSHKKKNKLNTSLLLLVTIKAIIMPILMTLIKLKAIKALILSKLAIKLVLGFVIYNLFTKLSGAKMTMMPMSAASTAYDRSSNADAQYLAYNAY